MSRRRVALVTGGTRGIGLGIARVLAERGWDLAPCGFRGESDVKDVVADLGRAGGQVDYAPADIAVRADREALVERTIGRYGRIDALINNAGRAPRVRADLFDASEESFEELMRVNLQGPYFLPQSFAGRMADERRRDASFRPSIVFITSLSAEMASPNRGEYCVSKAGLAMAVKLFSTRL